MKEQQLPPDHEWNNIYLSRPTEGQLCMSKKLGGEGHVGECIYRDGYFETYQNFSNRLQIIRWKHDIWLPVNLHVDKNQ